MKILLAVSGGMDSMYMLARSRELFPGSDIAVAHCNFCLRGSESEGDEEFVHNWCVAHSVPFFVKRFNTREYASERGISVEMAARDLRYAWFAELLADEKFDAVSIAHNANDNAETLMLNLLRGTGSRGLRGMSDRELGNRNGRLIRPILGVSREEIAEYMSEKGIPHREDRSNAGNVYKRNKLRNEVFPVFAEINPSFLKTLGADMRHLAQVDDIAEDYFQSTSVGVMVSGENEAISIPALMGMQHWEYILYRILEPYNFDEGTINALNSLLMRADATVSGKTFLAPAYKAVTTSDKILIMERTPENVGGDADSTGREDFLIKKEGEYTFNGQSIEVRVYEHTADLDLKRPAGQIIADAEKLIFPLRLREWEAGDWMRPLGMKGNKKKLSDIFVDLKWSLPQKENAIVLEHPDGADGHIGALLCERIEETLKVTPGTERIIGITLH